MDKDKLQKAMAFASENPRSPFSIELKQRMQRGEFNNILNSEGIDTKSFEAEKKPGLLKRAGAGLIKSEIEFGKSIAGAIDIFSGGRAGGGKMFEEAQVQETQTTQQLLKLIRAKKEKREDTSKLEKILRNETVSRSPLIERQAQLSTRQVLGQAGGVAVDILGGGTVGTKAAGIVTKPTTVLSGALRGAGTGALTGGGFGAAQGLARGLQEDKEGAELATDVISGGLVGGAAGGVLGGIAGGVSGGLRGRALRKQQLLDELNTNPELIAKFQLDDTGKILKDDSVKEVLRQGIPEKQVAVVKNASNVDKNKFKEMFRLAEKASKDARSVERPSDVVGKTIVDRTKHLLAQLKKSGQGVDDAANALRGQKADPTSAVQSFIDDLSDLGVTFKNGKPVFDGSDIQGIPPAESLIKKIIQRADKVTDDALEIHKLKKFIDEQVTFGKAGEGLTGQTERVSKAFRASLDEVLDTSFPSYDAANVSFKVARNLLDDTKTILGNTFDPNKGTIRAGSVARRILGNSANRGDILEYLKTLDTFFGQTGGKTGDDILTQTVFADILEDIFGTQATTGLSGQVQRGVEQAGGVVQDIGQGQLITGITRGAVRLFQATRGVSDEAKINALRKLIGA